MDGTGACLVTLPVAAFRSTISGAEVETASVFEELNVPENVVTASGGLNKALVDSSENVASPPRTGNTTYLLLLCSMHLLPPLRHHKLEPESHPRPVCSPPNPLLQERTLLARLEGCNRR
jgi:hypothetical protein